MAYPYLKSLSHKKIRPNSFQRRLAVRLFQREFFLLTDTGAGELHNKMSPVY